MIFQNGKTDEDLSDYLSASDHNTDSEQENEGDDDATSTEKYYIGKEKTKWGKHSGARKVRRAARNICTHLPGAMNEVKTANTPSDCFNLFIDNQMLTSIAHHTYIEKVSNNYVNKSMCHETKEIKALIGLLLIAGSYRGSKQNLHFFKLMVQELKFFMHLCQRTDAYFTALLTI